jgi:hypothetical protein
MTAAKRRLLDDVMVAAPCTMGWENMQGDNRVRFCNQCQLNVYNLSGMSDEEAEDLLQVKGDSICISLYRRADGTILTENCPVGLKNVKDKLLKAKSSRNKLISIAAAAALFLLGLQGQAQNTENRLTGGACPVKPAEPEHRLMGKPSVNSLMQIQSQQQHQTNANSSTSTEPKGNDHTSGADMTAATLLEEAHKNAAGGNLLLAEISYKKALEAASADKHDPKFRAKIRKEYAQFLTKQHREKEARALPH